MIVPSKGKVRIVFDAKQRKDGMSLSNTFLQGPDNNNALRAVLLRFRLKPVAFTADIKNMFHQFYVPEEDRTSLRFFWFKDILYERCYSWVYVTSYTLFKSILSISFIHVNTFDLCKSNMVMLRNSVYFMNARFVPRNIFVKSLWMLIPYRSCISVSLTSQFGLQLGS